MENPKLEAPSTQFPTYFTPTSLKQTILATLKPVFYNGGFQSGRLITVEGEISNTPALYGQAFYFNIKDEAGTTLNVRTFRNAFSFDLNQAKGSHVIVTGIVDLQEKQHNNADFDLLFKAIKVDLLGVGQIAQAEMTLIQELDQLGYFSNKRPLPPFEQMKCCRVGVITSNTSAANAFADIQQTLANLPFFRLKIFEASLYSPESIAKAIALADQANQDVLIVTRGGGERLEVFNDRLILDAVFKAQTPVIAAVGHAKDKMIIDRVADLAAATPTEAAKLLSDHYFATLARKENEQLRDSLNQLNQTLTMLKKEQIEKDKVLTDLSKNLEKSRKMNRNLSVVVVCLLILVGLYLIL